MIRSVAHSLLPWLALWLALVWPLAAPAQARFEFDKTPGNLPKTVLPSHYRLTLQLDPVRDQFSGSAQIGLQVREPVAAIELHADELKHTRVVLSGGSGGNRKLDVTRDETRQTWRLAPTDTLPIAAGTYRLDIAYTGVVRRVGEGLFRAEYPVRGRPARMLATQLQAVSARKVFPCFDEPAFRAVFEIAVRAPKGYAVVSNMPVATTRTEGERVLHRFMPTPPMPSYLVAVAVGRFDTLAGDAAGVPLRLLTAEGKREQARYALQVTRQVLPYYSDYFGIAYALPKLDQLAVAAVRRGAMEDWGLISYAEPTLLFDPARSSPGTQRVVFEIVAHEIAHQWFGNLVTAASWDEIWLNEAFATWLAAKTTEHFNPEWQVALHRRFDFDETMALDAGPATRAIRSGMVSERSVWDVFDEITYVKGGAVLSMVETWLGADTFRRGLQAYMRDRKLSNATAGDLWHAMAKVSGNDVTALAASWTDQPGVPLLQVRTACDTQQTRVTLQQERFSSAGEVMAPARWKIPVRLAHRGRDTTVLLEREQQTVELPGCSAEPLRANAGGDGFYRVQYSAEHLQSLSGRLADLPAADQVNLFSDTIALANAGRLPWPSFLTLLAAIPRVQGDGRAVLYTQAGEALIGLDNGLAGTPAQAAVRAAGRRLLGPELARLGWSPRAEDPAELLKLRGVLIENLARFDDMAVVEQARRLFDHDQARKTPLPASIRAAVVQAVGTHAGASHFEQLLKRLKAADGEEDRQLYAKALGAGRDAGRAEKLLNTALTGSVPSNVATRIAGRVSSLSPHAALAYRFTLQHFAALQKLAGQGGEAWLLPSAASGFNDRSAAQTLRDDQQQRLGEDGRSPAARIAAQIDLMAAVKQRDAQALQALLADWRPAP